MYIYHIITPEGIYVGQASGHYSDPNWTTDTIQGGGLKNCRLWDHFYYAYTKNGMPSKNSKDSKSSGASERSIKKYQMSDIKVRVFPESDSYGLDEKVYKAFANIWLPNGKRVSHNAELASIKALNLKEEDALLNIGMGNTDAYKDFKDQARNRTIDPLERLDMAEILHIYYLLKHNIPLLNEDMGGQTTGWRFIGAGESIISSDKVLYREMRPTKALNIFEQVSDSNAKIVGEIQHSITKAAQDIFTKEKFWQPIINHIFTNRYYELLRAGLKGKTDGIDLIIKEMNVICKNIKNDFQKKVRLYIKHSLKAIDDTQVWNIIKNNLFTKQLPVINWQEVAEWFSGYIYNIMYPAIEAEWNKFHERNPHVKVEKVDGIKGNLISTKGKWIAQTRKIDLKVGTGLDLGNLNSLLKIKTVNDDWKESMSRLNINNLEKYTKSQDVMKNYAIILFYYFYSNRNKQQAIFTTNSVVPYGNDYLGRLWYRGSIKQQIRHLYHEGGMSDNVDFLRQWDTSYNIMVKFASKRKNKQTTILTKLPESIVEPEDGKIAIVQNYIVSVQGYKNEFNRDLDKEEKKELPKQLYPYYYITKSVWGKIESQQNEPSLSDLTCY